MEKYSKILKKVDEINPAVTDLAIAKSIYKILQVFSKERQKEILRLVSEMVD